MRSEWASGGLVALILYFGYHAFAGEQGLWRWGRMQHAVAEKQALLLDLQTRNEALQSDIEKLIPGQVDLDFVEILARRDLSFVYEDEYVIMDQPAMDANMHR